MRSLLLSLCFCILFLSCNTKVSYESGDVIDLDLEKNLVFSNKGYLKPQDLRMILLDDKNPDSFFSNAGILDVVGDTILLLDNDFIPTKILMFNLKDGNYLGQINHQGEGPGEYRLIFGAFADASQQSVLIPDIDRPYVYNYSLKNDSLLQVYERENIMLRLQPIGNVKTSINIGEINNEGLKIIQYNSKFEKIDSILLKGFQGVPFITMWAQSGINGIIFKEDTISVIDRGQLRPMVSLNMGKYELKEKEAVETLERMIESSEPDSELLKNLSNYIILKDVQFTDENILLTYDFDNKKYSDLYDLRNGKILNRFEGDKTTPNIIFLDLADGHTLKAERIFTKGNVWYGIADESETGKVMKTEPGNSQSMIVSFKIQ